MPAIFLSHSSRDATAADGVKALLARLGFERVFLDFDKHSGIGLGENWEKRLYEELTRCHAVVLVLTPNWLASKWCFVELAQARALGKVILPILCEPLGGQQVLPEIQAADIVDWNGGQVERLEQRLRAISDELARGFTLDPNRPPFPGIHAFEAQDAAIYFGRDDETRSVIEKLDGRRRQGGARFVVVIGASGAGKSSLLKAGVLPQLAQRRAQWIVLPPIRPETAPLEALAKILAELDGQPSDGPRRWRAWHERLRGPDAATAIGDLIQDLRVGEARAASVLLPIDQFEEVFTIAAPAERDGFLGLLATLLAPGSALPLIAVATGRADVLHGLLEASDLAPLAETVPLPRMPLDRVPRLVEGPAAVAGLYVEKGLSERIARDVESPEALPLLAYMLRLLHARGAADRRLTLADYTALGDSARGLNPVQNAVRLAADEALASVRPTDAELTALRDAFVPHLVRLRLDDTTRLRQPAALAALPREAERLIRALTEARLLSARVEDGEAVVEVTHEALFAAWPMLAGWLDQEQAFLADIERLKAAHETWTQAPEREKPQALLHGLLLGRARDWLLSHPQRFAGGSTAPLRAFIAASAIAADADRARSERLRRRFVQAVAGAAVVFAVAAGVATWQYREAADARRGAVRNFNVAKQAADDVVFKLAIDLRNVQGMRVESIRKILDAAQALMDRLAAAAPDDLPLQHSRAAMLTAFVDTYLGAGDLTRARAAAEDSLSVARKIVAANPGNAGWQRVGLSLEKVGDVLWAAGDRDGALTAYQESLVIRRKIAATDTSNTGRQLDVSLSLNKVGDARLGAGDRVGALAVYEESLAIMRKLAAMDIGNAEWQRDASLSLDRIGDVRWAAGDRASALAAYEESLTIRRKLAATDPGNVDWRRNVSVSLEKVGSVRSDSGDRAGALEVFEECLTIRREFAAADPGNASWQRDLSILLLNIGALRRDAGDRAAALQVFEECLAITRRLAASDPSNAVWQSDLSLILYRLGDVRREAGDRAGALQVFDESLAIVRKLVTADPGNAGWQSQLNPILLNVGDLRRDAGDRAAALQVFDESLALMRKLVAADPGNAEWQANLVGSLVKVNTVSPPARARAALQEALGIVQTLEREGKLSAAQQVWRKALEDMLAKLPPEAAQVR